MAAIEAENKEFVRQFEDEVWNEGNLDAIEEYLAADFVQHEPTMGEVQGPDGWRKQVAEVYLSAFSDTTHTIEDVIAEDDMVVTRVKEGGTHTGEFMGIPPTNEAFEVDGVHIARIEDGKIAERWVQADVMGMMEQLGVKSDEK